MFDSAGLRRWILRILNYDEIILRQPPVLDHQTCDHVADNQQPPPASAAGESLARACQSHKSRYKPPATIKSLKFAFHRWCAPTNRVRASCACKVRSRDALRLTRQAYDLHRLDAALQPEPHQ